MNLEELAKYYERKAKYHKMMANRWLAVMIGAIVLFYLILII